MPGLYYKPKLIFIIMNWQEFHKLLDSDTELSELTNKSRKLKISAQVKGIEITNKHCTPVYSKEDENELDTIDNAIIARIKTLGSIYLK